MVKYSEDIAGKYASYLDDESSIAKGTQADKIWFPTSHQEVIEIVQEAKQRGKSITVSGGGTGISGGRAPPRDWIMATDEMVSISDPNKTMWEDPETGKTYGIRFMINKGKNYIRVPVGMTLNAILNCTREEDLLYPPDPTERSSFIGGNFATNASGARSFKFGATRNWIQSARIVLANGESAELTRGENKDTSKPIEFTVGSQTYSVPIPHLSLPDVTKHVAGPVLNSESESIDLFIGTNGIFGIVTEITLELLPLPRQIISMFAFCDTEDQAIDLISKCQKLRDEDAYPLPMSVEYLDDKAIKIMQMKDDRIDDATAVILLEQDVYSEEEEEVVLKAWNTLFESLNISNVSVALSHQENEHHKHLRHWVPEWIISTAKKYGFPLIVSDTSVPSENFQQFMSFLHKIEDKFRAEGSDAELSTTMLGHVGDSHPHLALIPTNEAQAKLSQHLLDEIIDKTVELGGSIASEHGLGKKLFDGKPAIIKQYGIKGIEEIRKIKEIMDPEYILCPGNIIPVE